jgi:hypothetical protein
MIGLLVIGSLELELSIIKRNILNLQHSHKSPEGDGGTGGYLHLII